MYLLAINSLPGQPLTMNFLAKMRFVNCRSFVKIKVGFMYNHSEAKSAKIVLPIFHWPSNKKAINMLDRTKFLILLQISEVTTTFGNSGPRFVQNCKVQ